MHCLRLKTGQNESISDMRDVYPSLKRFGALQTPRMHISLEGVGQYEGWNHESFLMRYAQISLFVFV